MVAPGVSGRDARAFNVEVKVKLEPTIRFKALFVTAVTFPASAVLTKTVAVEETAFPAHTGLPLVEITVVEVLA